MSPETDIFDELLATRERLSRMCDHGFPLIDALYWNRPSPKLRWYLMRQLEPQRSSGEGSIIDLRFPSEPRLKLPALIARLKGEHQPRYWYRGQRARRTCRYQGEIPAIDRFTASAHRRLNPIEVVLDATVPTAFRAITRKYPAQWSEFQLGPPLDTIAGPVRAIIASDEPRLLTILQHVLDQMLMENFRLVQLGKMVVGYDDKLLVQGTTVPHATLDLISLAQHYEYRSVMIDVSKDLDAAVWFATHDWDTGEVAGSTDDLPGVIYRFDADAIEQMMANSLVGPGAMPPPEVKSIGIFGLADISRRFDFLKRPTAQQGGSLLGMENILTHVLIEMSQAARAFEFDHDTLGDIGITLTRDHICPPDDPGLAIFRPNDRFPSTPITASEFEVLLAKLEEPEPRREHLVNMRQAGVL